MEYGSGQVSGLDATRESIGSYEINSLTGDSSWKECVREKQMADVQPRSQDFHLISAARRDAAPAAPGENRTASVGVTIGQSIGPYKLLSILGEGGMEIVYLAEQSQPVRRRVALKVIKLGMDTRSVIARFEAERQALAMMDHPNVAKVFD